MFRFNLSPQSSGPQHESFTALCLSQATNFIYSFKFRQAHNELRNWMPTAELSNKQEHLLQDHVLCVDHLIRGSGYFQEAKTCFKVYLKTPGLNVSRRLPIKSALADLFCELDHREAEKQTCFLSRVVALVSPEIEQLRLLQERWRKGFRWLLHCLIEAKIRQGYDGDAALLVQELLGLYSDLREPDTVDRLGHVSAQIAFARLSPSLNDAAERWLDVLAWDRYYNPLERDVFTFGVVYLFLCSTWGETMSDVGFYPPGESFVTHLN